MIKDLNIGDEKVNFKAIINNCTVGRTNGTNRSTYLNLTLQDRYDEINAKLWNATDDQVATIKEGLVVEVTGDVLKFNQGRQLKIIDLTILSDQESDQINYLQQSPVAGEELLKGIDKYINSIQNSKLRLIVASLVEKYYEKLLIYPAASKNHHEFVSGLAYHTYSMLRLAKGLSQLYPTLNADLLYSGVILHDLGKVVELSGPTIPKYTNEGKLIGHIAIGYSMIVEEAKELNISGEEVMLLEHMVLSHHGKKEFGSPVLPMIKEAEILSLIDNIDARMNMLDKALSDVEPGEFSGRIFSLENRSFYKPNLK